MTEAHQAGLKLGNASGRLSIDGRIPGDASKGLTQSRAKVQWIAMESYVAKDYETISRPPEGDVARSVARCLEDFEVAN